MEHAAREFNRAKGKMVDDFKTIVRDSEELLQATVNASGEGFTAARTKFAEKLVNAKAKLADVSRPAIEGAGRANDYVHDNPWTAVGVAAVVGILIGLLTARR